jgi:CRP/FNR family transcriptional regulator, cyclic AMP receptor protein
MTRIKLPIAMAAQAASLYAPARPGTLSTFRTARSVIQFRRAQMIYSQGDSAGSIFQIVKGRVFLNVVSNQGKEAVVSILNEGDYFGESCLVDHEARKSSAIALEATTVHRIERQDLRYNLRSCPDFCEEFMSSLLRRQSQIEEDLAQQLLNSSEQRLARVLVALAGSPGTVACKPLPRISQATLASMVGTTRSRISYFLCKFRKMGLIEGTSPMRVDLPGLESMLAASGDVARCWNRRA